MYQDIWDPALGEQLREPGYRLSRPLSCCCGEIDIDGTCFESRPRGSGSIASLEVRVEPSRTFFSLTCAYSLVPKLIRD